MSAKHERNLKIIACVAVIAIPVLLVVDTMQAHKYAKLKSELNQLEKKQIELIEKNRRLISDISVLSNSDRIEELAENELGMHKAKSEDIVRVEIKK